MAEEQSYQQSSAPTLCANNCGFFGNPTTLDLCSKCYRDHCLKEKQSQEVDALLTTTTATTKTSSFRSFSLSLPRVVDAVNVQEAAVGSVASVNEKEPSGPSRCGACTKRVGLTGFKCKCGTMYCGTHRYPEKHSCTFDYKEVGKEAIAKANPVIMATKLEKL